MKWFFELDTKKLKILRWVFAIIFTSSFFIGIGLFGFIFWLYLERCRKKDCKKQKAIFSTLLISLGIFIIIFIVIIVIATFDERRIYASTYYCTNITTIDLYEDGRAKVTVAPYPKHGTWVSNGDIITITLRDSYGTWIFKKMPIDKAKKIGKEPSHSFYRYSSNLDAKIYDSCHRNGYKQVGKTLNMHEVKEILLGIPQPKNRDFDNGNFQ